ncbi:helical bundle domain-containing protein [Legionella shakespearei]|uniref:Uncharacterized protein n=1 Tax=Legionella shakespearei DSM 23087 TaxID=1122169 RepID=A0A0W0Z2M4_9GAMM|nr:helical bundle domain-containing protein [Legionella shakespearei]KTD63386.1 hypothetical protein Lsha_0728 [Legionella shakespearei DSM 23087]
MLSSSSEYIQALREGNYLRFLEWPQFIAQQYATADYTQDADDTLNLLIFEWLNNGFCDNDVQHLAILYAVHDMESRPLRENLSYAVIAISIAAFQCRVYLNNNLLPHYLCKDKMNIRQLSSFMKSKAVHMDNALFAEKVTAEQVRFFSEVEAVDKNAVNKACEKINSIVQLRYLIEEYRRTLELAELPEDQLKSTRISVIIRLGRYLDEQMELTPEVTEEIASYVKKLWEMHPTVFEEDYLKTLSPLSFVDNSWKLVTDFGLRFFSVLQLNTTTLAITEAPTDAPKNA